jgi:hypothetical protein
MLMIRVLVGSARAKDPLRAIVPLGKPFGDLEPEDAADTELAAPTRDQFGTVCARVDLEGEDEPALEISERNREISMA